jgi:hypothetical protein
LVTVHAYVFRVTIAWQDIIIASHVRSYGREDEVLEPQHYLPVLLRKPGACARATPILQWHLPPVYETYHRRLRKQRSGSVGTKEYIQVLMLLKDRPLEAVTAAVERALRSGLYGYEVIKTALRGESAKRPWESPPVWPNRVDHFDQLLQRSGGA